MMVLMSLDEKKFMEFLLILFGSMVSLNSLKEKFINYGIIKISKNCFLNECHKVFLNLSYSIVFFGLMVGFLRNIKKKI